MKKILRSALAALLVMGSVCSLGACDKTENAPTDPKTEIPNQGTDDNKVPDKNEGEGTEVEREHNKEWVKTTYSLDAIASSLKDIDAVPEDAFMWAWVWGGDTASVWVPLIDGELYIPNNTTGLVVAFFHKDFKPEGQSAWDSKLGQTLDLSIVNGAIKGSDAPKPTPDGVEISVDVTKLTNALMPGYTMPTEYDLYVYPMGGVSENTYIKVEGGKVKVDGGTTRLIVAFMEKDAAPAESNVLAKTVKLNLDNYNIVVPAPIAPADLVEVAVSNEIIEANLKDNAKLPTEFDAYAFAWSNDSDGAFYKVEAGKAKIHKNAKNVIILLVPTGADADWNNSLGQTVDLIVENGKIVVNETVEFTVDMTKIKNVLPAGTTLPEEYDLYAWAFPKGGAGRWVKIEDGKFMGERLINACVLVFMPKGEQPNWDKKICQSPDLDIVDGAVVLPAEEAKDIEITVDLEKVSYNMQGGAEVPAEYDLYVWNWCTDADAEFIEVVDNKFTTKSNKTNVIVVFMKKGEKADWDNKLAQTNNLKIENGVIVYPVNEKPVEAPTKEFTVDMTLVGYNMQGGATVPTDPFDVYAYNFSNDSDAKWDKVVDGKVQIRETSTKIIIVFIKQGEAAGWGNQKLAQTVDLEIVDGAIKYPVTEKPAEVPTKEFTVDMSLVELNIKDGAKLPTEEYDVYAYNFSNGNDGRFDKVVDGKVQIRETSTKIIIVLVKKGEAAGWGEGVKLAQTVDLEIVDGAIKYPVTEKPAPTPDPETKPDPENPEGGEGTPTPNPENPEGGEGTPTPNPENPENGGDNANPEPTPDAGQPENGEDEAL